MITSFIPLLRCWKMFESCSLCDNECDNWPSNDDLFGRPEQTCSSPKLRSADRFASRHLRSVSTSQSELLCRSLHISKCNGSLTPKLGACQTNGLVSDHFKQLISLIPCMCQPHLVQKILLCFISVMTTSSVMPNFYAR